MSLVSGPRLNSSPPEAKNPGVLLFSNNLSVILNGILPNHKNELNAAIYSHMDGLGGHYAL